MNLDTTKSPALLCQPSPQWMAAPLRDILQSLETSLFHQSPSPSLHFFLEAREALVKREVIDTERACLVRALIVVARSCFAAAAPRDGLVALERADVIAQTLPDSDTTRQLANVKGMIYLELGDFNASLDAFIHSLEIAQRIGDRDAEARAIANLSGLLVDFGAYWDTLMLCERVLEMDRERRVPPISLATALNNMAEACLATHQAERGIELGNRALMALTESSARERVHLLTSHVLLARLHLQRGRIAAAERELSYAKKFAESTGFSRANLKVTIAASLIDHEKGKLRQAVQALKETLVLAGADSAIAKDALSALVTVYEKEGHPKSALRYLQRLSAMTERANLEHARNRLAEFGLANRDTRDANRLDVSNIGSTDFRLQTAALRRQLIDSQVEVLERLAIAAEMRDDVTGMHCYRVGKWAQLIALELGLPAIEADTIEIAARLHDIGKIGVPDQILLKPGKLTSNEYDVLKRHAVLGARLLSRSKTPPIRLGEKVALTHHERFDGSGYPQGLSGEVIPLAGRITAVADVFDALTHERPYKHAWALDDALREVRGLSGTWFDPAVVEAFFNVVERLLAESPDLDALIESKLKRSRIMRMREYVIGETKFNPDESGTFDMRAFRSHAPVGEGTA